VKKDRLMKHFPYTDTVLLHIIFKSFTHFFSSLYIIFWGDRLICE